MCKIQNCPKCGNIPHEQDVIYGKGNRLFNPDKANAYPQGKCSVCGNGKRKDSRLWYTGSPPEMPFIHLKQVDPVLRTPNKYPHIPSKPN